MPQLGDGAAEHGGFRASDSDREQAIDRLKTAFVHGMLARDEFDQRVGLALAARARGDLAALTADIPDQVPATPPPAERARPQRNPSVAAGAAIIAAPVFAAILAAALSGSPVAAAAIIFCLLVALTAIPVVAAIVRTILPTEARQARRSGGQPPPSPGVGGDRSQPALPPARPGRRRRGQARRPSSLAISMR